VAEDDLVIHCGDVIIQSASGLPKIMSELPGRKILVCGNHDKKPDWYMKNGTFDFACYALEYGHVYFTHQPAQHLPAGCNWNIHGHWHDDDHRKDTDDLIYSKWNRLFAIESTGYKPVLLQNLIEQYENNS